MCRICIFNRLSDFIRETYHPREGEEARYREFVTRPILFPPPLLTFSLLKTGEIKSFAELPHVGPRSSRIRTNARIFIVFRLVGWEPNGADGALLKFSLFNAGE